MNQIKTIARHLLLWFLYTGIEYLANYSHYSPWERPGLWWNIIQQLPLILLPSYFIAYWMVPRFLKKGRYIIFGLGVILVAALVLYGRLNLYAFFNYLEGHEYRLLPVHKVIKNTIRDYSVIALAVCIKIIDDWRRKDQLNQQLYKAKAEAEIKFLKAQLHPHFLFNTLNNIYGLSLQESDKVPDSILKLSYILDYLIYYGDKEHIELNKEVELIKNYIELEKLRYGQQLHVVAEFPILSEKIKTTPLILLPFVENAFKHSGKDHQGMIWIKLRLQFVEGKLIFNMENSKNQNSPPSIKENGIGIRNLKERLDLLYPNQYKLEINNAEQLFGIRLELELA